MALATSASGEPYDLSVECAIEGSDATAATVISMSAKMAFGNAVSSNPNLYQQQPLVAGGYPNGIPTNANLPINVQVSFSASGNSITSDAAEYRVEYPDGGSTH